MLTKSCKKVAPKYLCNICDYVTCRKSSYDKHVLTSKHLSLTRLNKTIVKVANMDSEFVCINCDKEYKSRTGLWYHLKKCKSNMNMNETNLILNTLKNKDEIISLLDIFFNINKKQKEYKILLCKKLKI